MDDGKETHPCVWYLPFTTPTRTVLTNHPGALETTLMMLMCTHHQAGFESPAVEVEKRVTEQAQTCETVKELLGRIKHLTSPDYFVALSDALVAAEAETNSTVTTDGSSAGYKKFAEKVKVSTSASLASIKSSMWMPAC